jgi:glycosyltransferase involved in cell wall biosynthesis
MTKLMVLHDGGSLSAFQKKGNLEHYVENLYNPGNYFPEVHIIVFKKEDLNIKLKNSTLKVHLISNISLEKYFGRIGKYFGLLISTPFLILQVYKLAKKLKIDIIRARNAYVAGFIAVTIGRLIKIPSVVSLGGDNRIAQKLLGRYYGYSKKLSYAIEEYSLRNASLVFCTNEFTKNYAIKLGVPEYKTSVINHRIDTSIIARGDKLICRGELGIDNNIVGLFIGRFEKDKQVDVIIEALPKVISEIQSITIHFIGDGSMMEEIKRRTKELNIEKFVFFHGYKNRESIGKFLTASDFIIIPMSGFVIYEAAYSETPIIAFNVEWHSEFVIHNETGLLVKDRNCIELSDAIINLSSNKNLRNKLSKNAYNKFVSECDQNMIIEKEIQEYKRILNN